MIAATHAQRIRALRTHASKKGIKSADDVANAVELARAPETPDDH